MDDRTIDLIGGFNLQEAEAELREIEKDMREADEENREEFVEAGLKYVKLSKPLPKYIL
jgi:hypothetical protein